MFAILLARACASSDYESELNAAFETGAFLLIPASNKGLTSLMSKTIVRLAGFESNASTMFKVVRKKKAEFNHKGKKGSP
jgi:hypothetical protein